MAAIEFDHVTKRFPDGTVAVDDIELTVADGEFMIFVGPSGCGKTTALRMVAGLEEITSGEIRIGGRVVNDLEPPDRDIAMVFQNYALYPHMSVADNIGFPLRMQRLKKSETNDRVREVALLLGIDDLLKRKPRELSGGQRQRRDGSRDHSPSASVPDGRAPLEPRREAARPDAGRAGEASPSAGRHDDLRHARPDRGDDARPARRRPRQGCHPAGGHAAGPLQAPHEHVRGQLHRQPGDELHPRPPRRPKVELGDYAIELADELRRSLRRDAGDVLVGLRPEEFEDARLHPDGSLTIVPAEIEVTEQLGPETFAYFRVEGLDAVEIGDRPVELAGALSARLDPRTSAAPGERLNLAINAGGLHLFDLEAASP